VRSYPGEELAAQGLVAAWLANNGMAPELQPTPRTQLDFSALSWYIVAQLS